MFRALLVSGLWLAPSLAWAHIELIAPPQRYPAANQLDLDIKESPCGIAADPPGTVPRTVFTAGETITVKWDEFIPHPGHFRIAFDPDGDDDLGDPAGYDDLNTPGIEILEDGIPHEDGKSSYEMQVTLPDVVCDNCTLQLIQVMTDKPPWGPAGGSDLYYQCADLILEASAGTDSGGGTGGGGSSTTSTTDPTGATTNSGGTSGAGTTATSDATNGTGAETTGADTDGGSAGEERDDASGCGCAAREGPTGALFLVLVAFRRRRAYQ